MASEDCDSSWVLKQPMRLQNGQILPAGLCFKPLLDDNESSANDDVAHPLNLSRCSPVDLKSNCSANPLPASSFNSSLNFSADIPLLENDHWLINPNELQTMNDFFQKELDSIGDQPLLDSNESLLWSNFLDNCLADDFTMTSNIVVDHSNLSRSLPVPSSSSSSRATSSFSSLPSNHHPSMANTQPPNYNCTPHSYTSYPITTNGALASTTHKISPSAPIQPSIAEPQPQPAESLILSVPGTVAIPVLAPRKKRHTSKDHLTEQEKRANHIASEQKRRQNIRMGFEALARLIPKFQLGKAPATSTNNNFIDNDVSNERKRKRSESVGSEQEVFSLPESRPAPLPPKATILNHTVEFIHHMHNRIARLRLREQELRLLALQRKS